MGLHFYTARARSTLILFTLIRIFALRITHILHLYAYYSWNIDKFTFFKMRLSLVTRQVARISWQLPINNREVLHMSLISLCPNRSRRTQIFDLGLSKKTTTVLSTNGKRSSENGEGPLYIIPSKSSVPEPSVSISLMMFSRSSGLRVSSNSFRISASEDVGMKPLPGDPTTDAFRCMHL